jgi:hypothetical protein
MGVNPRCGAGGAIVVLQPSGERGQITFKRDPSLKVHTQGKEIVPSVSLLDFGGSRWESILPAVALAHTGAWRDSPCPTGDTGANRVHCPGGEALRASIRGGELRSTDGPTAVPWSAGCGVAETETGGLLWLSPRRRPESRRLCIALRSAPEVAAWPPSGGARRGRIFYGGGDRTRTCKPEGGGFQVLCYHSVTDALFERALGRGRERANAKTQSWSTDGAKAAGLRLVESINSMLHHSPCSEQALKGCGRRELDQGPREVRRVTPLLNWAAWRVAPSRPGFFARPIPWFRTAVSFLSSLALTKFRPPVHDFGRTPDPIPFLRHRSREVLLNGSRLGRAAGAGLRHPLHTHHALPGLRCGFEREVLGLPTGRAVALSGDLAYAFATEEARNLFSTVAPPLGSPMGDAPQDSSHLTSSRFPLKSQWTFANKAVGLSCSVSCIARTA